MADFDIFRGDGDTLSVPVTQPDGTTPYSLTGKDIWFTAKRHISDSDLNAAISKTTEDGIEIDSEDDSLAIVTLSGEDTEDFPDKITILVYDVQVKAGSGDPMTVVRGTFRVIPDVTRATTL